MWIKPKTEENLPSQRHWLVLSVQHGAGQVPAAGAVPVRCSVGQGHSRGLCPEAGAVRGLPPAPGTGGGWQWQSAVRAAGRALAARLSLPSRGEGQAQGSQAPRGAQACWKPAHVALLTPRSPCSKTGKPSCEMAVW